MTTMSRKRFLEWIEQRVRLGHLIVGIVWAISASIAGAAYIYANMARDIKDVKEFKERAEPNMSRIDRNIIRIGAKLGVNDLENPR